MMINKYNRVFFAPAETDAGGDMAYHGPTTGTVITKKKRNLVTLSTPLIIKMIPYEKEVTVTKDGEQITDTVTYAKTNKSLGIVAK